MIPVNDVYQTVLTILNKEQRGYLDAEEFNHLAVLAQNEIFEAYFTKAAVVPMQGDDAVDAKLFMEEKIAQYWAEQEVDEMQDDSFFLYPSDLHRLGLVTTEDGIVIDQISHKEARYIKLSPLTSPSEKQPVYVLRDGGIKVFPDSPDEIAISKVNMEYIKQPTDPKVEVTVDDDGDIVIDLDNSDPFDLHPSEFTDIIIRICSYAGVTVRAQEVTQFAQQKEQSIISSEQ